MPFLEVDVDKFYNGFVKPADPDACWIWLGPGSGGDGRYGRARYPGPTNPARGDRNGSRKYPEGVTKTFLERILNFSKEVLSTGWFL